MATRQDLELFQGDDPLVQLAVTNGAGAAYDLTGLRVEIVVKTKSTAADDAEDSYTLSSVGMNPAIEINVIPTTGLAIADFTDKLATAGQFWYHAIVADDADEQIDRHTWAYGFLEIKSV